MLIIRYFTQMFYIFNSLWFRSSYIEVWFTDENFKPLEIEDKVKITSVINCSVKYKKWCAISVQTRDRIFVKGYGFLPFAKNEGKDIGKNVSKNLSSKYRQKFFDYAKQSATDALKTALKRSIKKQQKQLVIGLVIELLRQ